MLRPGGTATIIGMVPFGMKIELHGFDFLRDRKIQGTSMGGNRFRVDMPRLLSLWRQGRLKLDHLISGTHQARRDQRGLRRAEIGRAGPPADRLRRGIGRKSLQPAALIRGTAHSAIPDDGRNAMRFFRLRSAQVFSIWGILTVFCNGSSPDRSIRIDLSYSASSVVTDDPCQLFRPPRQLGSATIRSATIRKSVHGMMSRPVPRHRRSPSVKSRGAIAVPRMAGIGTFRPLPWGRPKVS